MAVGLDAGMVFINRYGCYDFASPFGGFNQCGWGKEMAIHSLDSCTRTKSVWLKIEEIAVGDRGRRAIDAIIYRARSSSRIGTPLGSALAIPEFQVSGRQQWLARHRCRNL